MELFITLKKLKFFKKKFNFKTNSDTEVLVNSYEYWKDKCFNYLDGMWATAIYDFKRAFVYQEIMLVKNRYFTIKTEKNLFFRQLMDYSNIKITLNYQRKL